MAEGVESVEGVLVEEELPVAVGEGAADQLDGIPEGLADVQVLAGDVGVVGGYGRGARCEVVEEAPGTPLLVRGLPDGLPACLVLIGRVASRRPAGQALLRPACPHTTGAASTP
ncbi:hypothetical protein GCM10010293_61340 [Streptomyces griseoflavus]|nr:hypothetical protein GCM10010293_61340 [Streptomyces griseoflavus]